jgi:hypothetical protein
VTAGCSIDRRDADDRGTEGAGIVDWAVVHRASSRPDAEVVAAVLRGHGIEVLVTGDDVGTLDGALAFSNGVEVRVPDRDAPRARDLLRRSPVRRRRG